MAGASYHFDAMGWQTLVNGHHILGKSAAGHEIRRLAYR